MQKFLAFLRLGRLHFLAGGFILNALGVVMALYNGATFDLGAFLLGQLAITCTQLATHYSNDYFDLAADRANLTPTRWSGGSRVLPDGHLTPQSALRTALILTAFALVAAFALTITRPTLPFALPLILLALFLSWSYSAPPFRLHSRGLGELTTAVLVPGLTPLVAYYLQAGRFDSLLLAVLPLCCFQFAMLLTIEFPDQVGDAAVGKNTLVVRLSAPRAAQLYQIVLILAYVSLPLLVATGLPLITAFASIVPLPFALLQWHRMNTRAWADPSQWNNLAFTSVALLIATAALQLLAFTLLLGLS
jgi:1,4-dihydroxy-2-naphthoate polyprenyltransferase